MHTKEDVKKGFIEAYGAGRECEFFFSPGRVNLIGEHIDYNGGLVLPAALSLGISAAIRRRNDGIVRLRSATETGEANIRLEDIRKMESARWANYPAGVMKYLSAEGHSLAGYDIFIMSDLPESSGLSSSAALEVLTGYMMLCSSGNDKVDRVKLSLLCQKVENEFIGVNCGIMDQFVVALGRKDHAILLNTNTLEYKYIPFSLGKYRLLIMNTKKRRELADSKYNERRAECEAALAVIQKTRPARTLVEADAEDLILIKDPVLRKRARHVITENKRVQKSVAALGNGELATFGNLMCSSHDSLKTDYEVTGFELDTIVAEALAFPTCLGARMTGAGFGGCAIALVQETAVEPFTEAVLKNYKAKTGLNGEIYVSVIGDGVKAL
jgi:galactokinase